MSEDTQSVNSNNQVNEEYIKEKFKIQPNFTNQINDSIINLTNLDFNKDDKLILFEVPSNFDINKLKDIEKQSQRLNETQIFIETPYRNQHMLEDILASCGANTKLCIARNVSLETEFVVSKTIAEWKKSELPDLHKQPTVFLLLA
mgnify:CR=1 FL=1